MVFSRICCAPCAESCLVVLRVTADFSQKGFELGNRAGSHRAPSKLRGERRINNEISYRAGTRSNTGHQPVGRERTKENACNLFYI